MLGELVEKRREGKDIVFENRSEAHDASAGTAKSVVDGVIVRGIGGGRPRAGFRRLQPRPRPNRTSRSAATEVSFGAMSIAEIQFERQKSACELCEDVFDRGKLHQVLRIARAEGKTLAAIDDGAAQAQGDCRDAISVVHRRNGIEIVGAHYSGEIGIEALVVSGPCQPPAGG